MIPTTLPFRKMKKVNQQENWLPFLFLNIGSEGYKILDILLAALMEVADNLGADNDPI